MKMLLILLAIGLATCDKLDRTYLPPPGSAAAGGNSEDLNLPLEFPNESAISEPESDATANSLLSSKYPNIAIGIDRQGPSVAASSKFFPNRPEVLISNINSGPTTTTSYSLNPISNYSPTETYDSTVRSMSPVLQQSSTTSSSFVPNLSYDQYLIQQNKQPNNNLKSIPSSATYNSIPRDDFTVNFRPEGSNLQEENVPQNPNLRGFSETKLPDIEYGDDLRNTPDIISPKEDISYFDKDHNQPSSKFYSPQQVPDFIDTRNVSSENFYDPIKNSFSSTFGPGQTIFSTSVTKIAEPSNTSSPSKSFQDKFDSRYSTIIQPQRSQSEGDRNAVILNYENILTPEGFTYSFDTSNGIHVDESGTAIGGVKAKGSYSFTGDDGKIYSVEYTADENGFLPRGDHLPTAPPIPNAILRNIAQAEKNKELGIIDDGSYDEAKYGHGRYQGLRDRLRQNQDNSINVQPDFKENEQHSQTGILENVFPTNTANNGETSIKQSNGNNPFSLEFANDNNKPTHEPKTQFKGEVAINSSIIDENLPTNTVKTLGIFRPMDYPLNSPKEYNTEKDYSYHPGYEYSLPQNVLKDNSNHNYPSQLLNVRKNYVSRPENQKKIITDQALTTTEELFNSEKQEPGINSQVLIQTVNDPNTAARNINSFKMPNINDGVKTAPEGTDSALESKHISSTSKPYFYNSPYTSNGNDKQRNGFPSAKLGYQYSDSTTPLPSEISSRLTSSTNGISSPVTTPTPQFTSTLRSSISSGRPAIWITERPRSSTSRITILEPVDESRVSVTEPNAFGKRIIGRPVYQGGPKIPVTQAGSSKDVQAGVGKSTTPRSQNVRISSKPESFGIQSSTEKIFGEDFRGPKQPQRYDPEHGYYY